ncbi:MAG: hypothetical protein K2X00_06460 [Nitrospiraceae bacterium]|nr:hypothetical protein [Nitrospiraceae bacterium]
MPHMLIIGWLALLTCLWTTGDLVVDLVFETPDVTSNADASAEEPDNAAEHLLMPSERADHSPTDTLTSAPATDFHATTLAVTAPDNAALKTASSHHPPPRSSPVSFSIPLRI